MEFNTCYWKYSGHSDSSRYTLNTGSSDDQLLPCCYSQSQATQILLLSLKLLNATTARAARGRNGSPWGDSSVPSKPLYAEVLKLRLAERPVPCPRAVARVPDKTLGAWQRETSTLLNRQSRCKIINAESVFN